MGFNSGFKGLTRFHICAYCTMSETNLCDVKNSCRIVPKYSGTEHCCDSTFTEELTICSACFPVFSSGITWNQIELDKSLTTIKQRNKSLVTCRLKEVSVFLFVNICYRDVSKSDLGRSTYCSFATRVSQLKIWNFLVTGIERNVCRCTFNRFIVIR